MPGSETRTTMYNSHHTLESQSVAETNRQMLTSTMKHNVYSQIPQSPEAGSDENLVTATAKVENSHDLQTTWTYT